MDLKAVIDVLLRRKGLFALGFLLILAGAVLGLAFLTPVYESAAKLYYQPLALENVTTVIGTINSNRGNNLDDHSHLEMLSSPENLQLVIERLQLRDRSGRLILAKDLSKSVPLTSLLFPRPYLSAQHTSDTFVLEIKATSPDAEQAAMLANTLAAIYVDRNRAQRLAELDAAREKLRAKFEDVRKEFLELQAKLRQSKIDAGIISLSEEYSQSVEKFYDEVATKSDALKELATTSGKVRKLRDQLRSVGIDYVPGAAFDNYPAVSTLVQKINELQNDMAAAKVEFKDGHPEMARYRERLKELNRQLEHSLRMFKLTDTELQSLERQEEGQRAAVAAVDARIAAYSQIMRDLADKTLRLSPLNLDVSSAETAMSTLLENLYKVILAESLTYDQIRIVQPAAPKRRDDTARPKTVVFLVVGTILGVVSGCSLAFLVDYLDESVRGVADAKKHGLTVLGVLPREGAPDIRALRDLKTRLRLAAGDPPPRLIVVAGLRAGGLPAVAAYGLGRVLAGGGRVLVAEADLIRPSLASLTGRGDAVGLASVLEGGMDAAAACRSVGPLWVLPAGPAPVDDPGRLLHLPRLSEVLAGLRRDFDTVLLVAPALEDSTDGLILAARADAVLLATRSGAATGRALVDARDALAATGTPVLGLVLAGCSATEGRGLV